MRMTVLTIVLALLCTQAFAQKVVQCERYKSADGQKRDRTIFTLSFSPDESSLTYKKLSGPDWFLPSETALKVIWKSEDNLRVVACWIDEKYEKDDSVWHPVYILDVDYAKPRFKTQTYGGFSDFDEVVSSPWLYECARLD